MPPMKRPSVNVAEMNVKTMHTWYADSTDIHYDYSG